MNQVMTQGARTPAPVFTAETLGLNEADAKLFVQAQFYSMSTVVPKEYQGNISNCYIALQTAKRMKKDPLFVMNGLNVIHSRPSWSSKSLIQLALDEVLETLDTVLDQSDPNNWKCYAIAKTKAGREVKGMEITVKMAKDMGWWDRNPMWRNATELMLTWRASGWLINTKFPQVTMGFPTKEEIEDTAELQQQKARPALNELLKAAAEAPMVEVKTAPEAVVVEETKVDAPAPQPDPVTSLETEEAATEEQQVVEMFKRITILVKERGYTEEKILELTGLTKAQIRKQDLVGLVKVYKQLWQ